MQINRTKLRLDLGTLLVESENTNSLEGLREVFSNLIGLLDQHLCAEEGEEAEGSEGGEDAAG